VFPSVPKKYCNSIAESVEVDPILPAVDMISGFGGIFGGKFVLKPKIGHTVRLNVYSINCGNPSIRKSPVKEIVYKPFGIIESGLIEDWKPLYSKAKARYDAACKEYEYLLKKPTENRTAIFTKKQEVDDLKRAIPPQPRLIVDSATPEKLTDILADNNGRVMRISGEGGVLADVKGRYAKTSDIDMYLSAYSGERFSRDTKGGGTVIIEKPALTISVAAQIGRVKEFIADYECMSRGLCARFFYTFGGDVEKSAYSPPLQGESEWQAFIEKCYKCVDFDEIRELKLSPEAFALYAPIYNDIQNNQMRGEYDYMGCWLGEDHLLRITANLHCVECVCNDVAPETVSIFADTMQRGIECYECLFQHAKHAFLLNDKTVNDVSNSRYLLKKLKGITTITVRDLWQKCRGSKRFAVKEDITEPLSMLEEYGYITTETIQNPKGGQPSETITVIATEPPKTKTDDMFADCL
jgi:hypothetical protein